MSATPDDRLRELVAHLTVADKVRLLTGDTFWTLPGEPVIGLRGLVMSDGPVGVRGQRYDEREPSACLPTESAVGATWDVELAERLGRLLGDEARRKDVDVVLAPTINLQRDPRGGRNFENFAEDPLLVAELGRAVITGIQSREVAATAKHFVANDSETDRFTVDVGVDETTLREVYLAPFAAAVEAGVWLVMAAYNSVNGATMTENPLQRDVLKHEWGFAGAIVSDWFAARSVDAAGDGLLDLVMPGPVDVWGETLTTAIAAGDVPESAIDDKLLRLLRVADFVGALDPDVGRGSGTPADACVTPLDDADQALLRDAARLGTVLLRNEQETLPLPDSVATLAVIGDLAEHPRVLGGGSATVIPTEVHSFADGLAAAAPQVTITRVGGVPADDVAVPIPVTELQGPAAAGPGITFRYLAADATPLASEHRRASVVQWPLEGSAGVAWPDIHTITGRTTWRPTRRGTYRVALAGAGSTRLAVGAASADAVAVNPADDTNGVAHRPPAEVAVEVTVAAGEQLPIEFVHTPDPAGRERGAALALTIRLAVDEAAAAAATHDVAIVVVGTGPSVESEGFDRATLALPGAQDRLVAAVAAANPRTVVVVNAGAPVLMPWREAVAAILVPWFPGQQAGHALADVIFGHAEPGGRLPMTWPDTDAIDTSVTPVGGALEYAEGVRIAHRREQPAGAVAYRFGHGLGYTTWSHELVACEPGPEDIVVRVEATNTGTRAGRDVVAVWARSPQRPWPRLVGFATVAADPTETVEVTLAIPRSRLALWFPGRGWVAPEGPVTFAVGPASGPPVAETVIAVAAVGAGSGR